MIKISYVLLLILFVNSVDITYLLKEQNNFKIIQKNHYRNPDYKESINPDDLGNIGPVFNETFISDKSIKTINDLNKYYSLNKIKVPENWESNIDLNDTKYMVASFPNGIKMPVIVISNKFVFSFSLSDDILTFDDKVVIEKDGIKTAYYATVEIERKLSK